MGLPKSRFARVALGITAARFGISGVAMAYFQPLDPPRGAASAAQLVVPRPAARPALVGAGIQLASLKQAGFSDGPGRRGWCPRRG